MELHTSTPNKPNEEVITADTWNTAFFYVFDPADNEPAELDQVTGNYTFAGGGLVHEHAEAQYADSTGIEDVYWVLAPGGNIVTNYSTGNGPTFDYFGTSGPFPLPLEAGKLSLQNPDARVYYPASASEGGSTKVGYLVGGTGQLNQQVLLAANATSQQQLVQRYSGYNVFDAGLTYTNAQVTDGDLGQQGDDGMVYKVESAGSMVDVTATASAPMQYPARTGVGPYVPVITANGGGLSPCGLAPGANFCVGEGMTFDVAWNGSVPAYVDGYAEWTLPGTFVNEKDSSQGPLYYYENKADLYRIYSRDRTFATGCWYVTGFQDDVASVKINLEFKNGQWVTINAYGQFEMFRPTATFIAPIPAHGAPQVGINGNALSLGQNGNHDMSFEHIINAFDSQAGIGYDGTAAYSQLLQGSYEDHFSKDTEVDIPYPGALDNHTFQGTIGNTDGLIYCTPTFYDAPSLELDPGYSDVTENMNFQTYLLFAPSGGIYVPLRCVTWTLNMSATYNSRWQPSGSPPEPHDADCTSFPKWTQTYTNQRGIAQ